MNALERRAYKSLPSWSPVRVYMRIVDAAKRGSGVQLSASEVHGCMGDEAVIGAVETFLEEFTEREGGS